jgi:hypothetical protein
VHDTPLLLCYYNVTLQVTLLDPVRFPGAIKVFVREICRNDLLNFGRLHFFFPDSRLALDLSTDKTLKEARFDRHFVRVSAVCWLVCCATCTEF